MATGPVDADRAALEQRCAAAEAEVERLRAELAEARAALDAAVPSDATGLGLFSDAPAQGGPADGTDQRVLSVILAATAVVAAMVAVLALVNGTLFSPFGLLIVALTVVLAWGAARTRVVPTEVSVTRGVVLIVRGEDTHRFDVRSSPATVTMHGRPGDTGWELRFARRGLDPFVVDASMVDVAQAEELVTKLREWRPEL